MEQNLKIDDGFEQLKQNVKELLNFNTFQYKDTFLGRRFSARLRALHIDNYHDYIEILKKDKKEQEKLLQELTINVTEFFRDTTVWDTLKNDVIPLLLREKTGRIKIWSAGSSDGKEAYSIAMIFSEVTNNNTNRAEIIGTDIDRDCLNEANLGEYVSHPGLTQTDIKRQLQFIGNPERFFDVNGNIYRVKPLLKTMTHFQYHDLISDPKKHGFDLILCRNVVIYFTRDLQEVLYKDFYNALNPGGFFVMGKTETLVGEARELFIPYNLKERIFRKPL
ncbi:MAG: protein-glutamate O-methyltransferase CheR [Candidatus Thermoplasmatota archaeon]